MFQLLRDQKGQGIMEYVIISSLVGICCLVAVKEFGGVVQRRIDNMKSYIAQEISIRGLRQ